jgi:hypothetical protein
MMVFVRLQQRHQPAAAGQTSMRTVRLAPTVTRTL